MPVAPSPAHLPARPAPASPPPSPNEERKRRQLVTTRRRATALLAVVAAVFVGTVVAGAEGGSWLGYVQATAEASMVGGLADWFAVVALFRHPLGVPIPHTAIITERKEQFGETLGEFIQSSFMTPDAIGERVLAARPGHRLGLWLSEPDKADRLAGHLLGGAVEVTELLEDDVVHDLLEGLVRDRLESTSVVPLAGKALAALTKGGRHDEVVDAALRGLDRYLDDRRDDLRSRFRDQAPWWLPGAVEDRIFERLLDGVRAVLDDMANDRGHGMRQALNERILAFVHDLQHDPALRARGEQLTRDLLEQPEVRTWVASIWTDAKAQIRAQAGDDGSRLRTQLAGAIVSGGQRLLTEPALSAKVDDGAEAAARYVVEHFGHEITRLVSDTIARWDGEETSRRLELLLGPDLQFIRINGTVVGGLAGLALHAIAQALG
ncbi:MAG TPA: DUF445 domain-containing protein [Acidimicrobiales bacterium]|nr:DUF445 domain-containing protein [Acidimicrobiales bacterium]